MTRRWLLFLFAPTLIALAYWGASAIGPATRSGMAAPATEPIVDPIEDKASFRILFGLTDKQSTEWDGSVSIASGPPGRVAGVEPWRFEGEDRIEGESWKLSTHLGWLVWGTKPGSRGEMRQSFFDRPGMKIVANGVVVALHDLVAESAVQVRTKQGDFEFRSRDVPYGSARKFLDGRVMVDRVPISQVLAKSSDDQDYPASVVDQDGTLWVAFLQFTPNPKSTQIRMFLAEPIEDMNELAEPAVGDKIILMCHDKGSWSDPVEVTAEFGDRYRPALAVDESGRVWVFWSENAGGNFDLYARSYQNGTLGEVVRITRDPGSDVFAVAATDSSGRVWVAWQAFRNGRAEIHASHLTGSRFSGPVIVAASAANEWNPAIAASPGGDVTVAWDSYRSGDYDVFVRTFDKHARLGNERAVAESERYEAHPSLAYDPQSRMWIAWEESDKGWGKDFGAYETSGIGLYQGRWIELRVLEGNRLFTAGDLGSVLPGPPSSREDSTARQGDAWEGTQPDPTLVEKRAPHRYPVNPPRPLNSYPRLLADPGGRVWLAYRTAHPLWRTSLGKVWFENVVSYDGQRWSSPIFVPHSDNLLDNRPALTSDASGGLWIVGSSDGRQMFDPRMEILNTLRLPRGKISSNIFYDDSYNNDVYVARIQLPAAANGPELDAVAAVAESKSNVTEDPHARRVRDYRAEIGDVSYQILRGEFHRHTEISMDGDRDGSLLDAWRYFLDAAALDWVGCCDHDNGWLREYPWWITQKLTDIFHHQGTFVPMFHYERSMDYPEGHRNVIFAQRGIRPLPRLAEVELESTGSAPDTRMLYRYLRHFNGIAASHTSGTDMGTDWRDNDPLVEPIVEIYQGDRQNYERPDAPRANSAEDSIGGWRPKGFISLALERGYRLGFQASSDHISTHMSYCNLYTTGSTREAVLEAFQKRHVYGATDDILADVRSGSFMMGDEFETREQPSIWVKLVGTAPFSKVHIVKDNQYVFTTGPNAASVEFTWRDTAAQVGKTSFYYVRGEQADGEIVWASPMWITYKNKEQ